MDFGAWASLVGALVALFAAAVAVVQADAARQQVGVARQQAVAAEQQADAARQQAESARAQVAEARRANDLMEKADRERREGVEREHRAQAVVWAVDGVTSNGCRLVNMGHSNASNVVVKDRGHETDWLQELNEGWQGEDVAPGEALPFSFGNRFASKTVHALYVLWEGQGKPVPVKVPHKS